MAHAYTPGLRVTSRTRLKKRRILPLPGKVLAEVGQRVSPETVVARAELPGDVMLVNAVSQLGVTAAELSDLLLKQPGEPVTEGEVIAETKPLIKWFKSQLRAPVSGTLESVSSVTGQVIVRTPPKPVEINAYVSGTVTEIVENEGVAVETLAGFAQGIFGIGPEVFGPLVMGVDAPEAELTAADITEEHRGAVLVGGAFASGATLLAAVEKGVAGLVVGGFHDRDLRELLGYDLGVAITGSEQVGITLIMTEGFGTIPMVARTFELLRSRAGARASINGATQIRAGVMRPEIVIPWEDEAAGESAEATDVQGLEVGTQVRVIRQPYFGRLGKVAALPSQPEEIETEASVRVAEISFDGESSSVVPRANLEMIER